MSEYITEEYHNGDEQQIVDLLNNVFNPWQKEHENKLDYWNWKYRSGPEKAHIVVSKKDEEIIGCHHGPLFKLRLGDNEIKATYGTDMAVQKEYQNQGISRNQIDLLKTLRIRDNIKQALVLASNPYNIKSLEKREPKFPHRLCNLARIRDIDKLIETFEIKNPNLVKIGYLGLKTVNKLLNPKEQKYQTTIEKIKEFDDDINIFWEKQNKLYAFVIKRDKNYLNWRYCDPRSDVFTKKIIKDGNKIEGYIITAINNTVKKHPVGFIVELHALKHRQEVINALLSDALKSFDETDVNLVNYLTIKDHVYEKTLEGYGFLDSRVKFHLFYKNLQEKDNIEKLKQEPPHRIYFCWGDHDTLPVKVPQYE